MKQTHPGTINNIKELHNGAPAELPCLSLHYSREAPGGGELERWSIEAKAETIDEAASGLDLLLDRMAKLRATRHP